MPDHTRDDDDDRNRRSEDRDRMLHKRLDQMESERRDLSTVVAKLESSLAVVKLEQEHLKELFSSRLHIIEQGQALQLSEIKSVSLTLTTMMNEPERTPGGRVLKNDIQVLSASVDENKEALELLRTWKDGVNGVLFALKWVGAGGLVSLGIWILKGLKFIP